MITHRFLAKPIIHFGELYGNITLRFADINEFIIDISGDEELSSQVSFSEKMERLIITCPIPEKPGQGGFFRGTLTFGSVFINGVSQNLTVVNGVAIDTTRPINLDVTVPFGTQIRLMENYGKVDIVDVAKDVTVVRGSMAELTIGSVGRNASIENNSVGDISVKSVSGVLILEVTSTGSIIVEEGTTDLVDATLESVGGFKHRGEVNKLKVKIGGTGNTKVNRMTGGYIHAELDSVGSLNVKDGNINDVTLTVDGTGKVQIDAPIIGKIASRQSSVGKVKLTNPNNACEKVDASVTGTGDFEFEGWTLDSTLRATGIGCIKVKKSINMPFTSISGLGKIKYNY